MAKTLCKVGGIVLLLVGIAGFFAPTLLGMHLTIVHDVIHLVTGGAALAFGFGGTERSAARFCVAFGATYLLVALLGFVAPDLLGRILGHGGGLTAGDLLPDNVVHVLLGGTFLGAGIASLRKPG